MRVPVHGRGSSLKFNITPLIDVVFLLIIFFLVASYLAGTEQVEAIELARAATGKFENEAALRRLVVTVTADETLHVGSRALTQDEFSQLLLAEAGEDEQRPLEVRIRADRRVPYRVIEPLLVACARAGITKLKFNVMPGS